MTVARAEEALRRVEEAITTLDALPETRGRQAARELMEAVLDLHGAALARMTAIVAMSGHAESLYEAFAADHQVAGVLLLHGLHPEMPDVRVRRALEALRPSLRAQGVEVMLAEVTDGVARLRLRMPGASREEAAMLRREVEAAIVEAAPDLAEIAILNEVANASFAAP
jgi:hypothetical protein